MQVSVTLHKGGMSIHTGHRKTKRGEGRGGGREGGRVEWDRKVIKVPERTNCVAQSLDLVA